MIDPSGGGLLVSILNIIGNFLKFFFSRKSTYTKKLENIEKLESMLLLRLQDKKTTELEKTAISRQLKTITFFLTEGIDEVPAELTEVFYKVRLPDHVLDKNIKDSIKKELQVDDKGLVKKQSYRHSSAGLVLGLFMMFISCIMLTHGLYNRVFSASIIGFLAVAISASFIFWVTIVRTNIKTFEKAVIRYYQPDSQKASKSNELKE